MPRHCDVQSGDKEWIEEFQKQIDMLAGCVIEMMETNKVLVLSHTFRELLVEKAYKVQNMLRIVSATGHLVVDNPGKPLKEWKL